MTVSVSFVFSVRNRSQPTTADDSLGPHRVSSELKILSVLICFCSGLLAPFELSTEAPPPESSVRGNKEMEMITRSQERAGSQEMDQTRWKSRDGTISPTWCSVSDNVSAHTNVPLRRKLFSSSRSSCLSLYRSGSTGSEMFWGVPQPVESLAGYTRRSSSTLVCYCAYLSLDEYPPLVGVDTMHPSGVAPRLQDPSSSPPPELFVSPKFLSPRRFKKRFGVLPPPRLISPFVGRRPEPMARPSPDLSYLLTRRRTSYTVLSLYRRVTDGFTGIAFITTSILLLGEANLFIHYLLVKESARSGLEDATDFVSTIFRGADWVLTSPLYVTIFQLSDFVVKALSTHSKDGPFPLFIVTKRVEFE
ncbi:hypothetical protein Bca101_093560 [Brassica carinata]